MVAGRGISGRFLEILFTSVAKAHKLLIQLLVLDAFCLNLFLHVLEQCHNFANGVGAGVSNGTVTERKSLRVLTSVARQCDVKAR